MTVSPRANGRRRSDATERVLRFVRILGHLRSLPDGALPRAAALAAFCECSRSSLFRDLGDLVRAGLVEQGERRGVWRLTARGRAFPMAPLTAEDAIALALARALLDRPGIPHGAGIQAALEKATSAFSPALQRLFREASRAIEPTPPAARLFTPEVVFDALFQAVRERRSVALDYRSQSGERGAPRWLDPYGITYEADRVYLHAWSHGYNMIRTYRLDRVEAVTVTDQRFERDEAVWQAYRGQTGVFLGLRGGPPVTVEVRFAPQVADYVLEPGRWSEGWMTVREADGSVLLTGTALGTDGILVELLRWRRHAHVLGGPELLAVYRAELDAMTIQHEKNLPDNPHGSQG